MVDYREILRQHSLGGSKASIALSVHSSRNTVRDVIRAATAKNICWPLDFDITNKDLELLLFPDKYKAVSLYAEPDCAYIHRELAKRGVTLTLLWEEYCSRCRSEGRIPYQSTQFGEKYRKWARVTKATMRIQHKPGDAMEVDWAGDTIPVFDPVTGEEGAAYLFVAVLPCSCYAYAEAHSDMQTENWLQCHVNAYRFFGGVARLLIPDNCRTSTTSNTRYETILNRSYNELAEHYGTAIVPARVRKPKDKSHAESSVSFAETWIIAALRDRKFFSIYEVQEAVAEKLEDLNRRSFKKRRGCRESAYAEEERSYMLPLPDHDFEPAVWSVAKVSFDYLVTDGRNKYSVPCNLIGEKVDIRATRNIVEVFFHGSRVASHLRLQTAQHDPVVKPEHMPPEHRRYLSYNESSFREWAESVGTNTAQTVQHFLGSGRAPEQGYKACAGLMKLGERYSTHRLENACKRLLEFSSSPTVRNIASILKNGQDRVPNTKGTAAKPEHTDCGITRGAAYFRRGGEQK